MTSEELESIIAGGETLNLECKLAKSAIPVNFWETFSAFANTDGGMIVLGVREENRRFSIEGVDDARKIVVDFWNMVHSAGKISADIVFDHHVQIVSVKGKSVVVIEVPRADRQDRPVYIGEDVFKGTFRRNGDGDYRCSREAITAMIRDQGEVTSDACVLDELTISDLGADTLRRYRTLFGNFRPEHSWNRLPDDEFLTKIGAAKRGRDHVIHPTKAGLVCFADFNVISDVFPNFFLDYREHLRTDVRWTDRVCSGDATWSGNVFDFFYRINQSITAGVKVPFKLAADNVTRDDDTPVHQSLREVLANALIHADYDGRQGIVVDKYPRKLVISNPGILRISKSVAVSGGTSDARNSKIFNIFSLVKIGERSGMGLSQLFDTWKAEGYVQPVLKETYDPDRTWVEVEFESTEKRPESTEKSTGNASESTEKSTVKFSETEERIIELMRENAHITQGMLSTRLGITRNYVAKITMSLTERGAIRRIGPDKGGVWEVLKK